ncbi:MAG: hypothetical protein ACI4FY_06895 [Acetatifactor sp.]
MREFGLSMIVFVILCLPMFGLLIGVRRNKKHGEEIKRKMEEEEKAAQERGGISSLYYKRSDKRTFKRIYGTPMIIGFLAALVLLCVILKLVLSGKI